MERLTDKEILTEHRQIGDRMMKISTLLATHKAFPEDVPLTDTELEELEKEHERLRQRSIELFDEYQERMKHQPS